MHFLIVTHDAVTEDIFGRIADEMKAVGEFRDDAASGFSALEQQRFDVVVIDCDDVYRGDWLLRNAHKPRPNRSSVVVAITNGGTQAVDAEDSGADFVVAKPLSPDQARIDLQRLCQAVAADQRHNKRHPVQLPIFLSFGQVVDRRAEAFNLSLGGIGVRVTEPIEDDDMIHVRFWLPDCATSIRARGEIAWSDRDGNTGIKFTGINPECHGVLADWLGRNALRVSANAVAENSLTSAVTSS
jgi:CheY-like chemotaxis protein